MFREVRVAVEPPRGSATGCALQKAGAAQDPDHLVARTFLVISLLGAAIMRPYTGITATMAPVKASFARPGEMARAVVDEPRLGLGVGVLRVLLTDRGGRDGNPVRGGRGAETRAPSMRADRAGIPVVVGNRGGTGW